MLLEVCGCEAQDLGVVLEVSESAVASTAEEGADLPCVVVVVDVKLWVLGVADRALAILVGVHLGLLLERDSMSRSECVVAVVVAVAKA
jgi:hypothetical protein